MGVFLAELAVVVVILCACFTDVSAVVGRPVLVLEKSDATLEFTIPGKEDNDDLNLVSLRLNRGNNIEPENVLVITINNFVVTLLGQFQSRIRATYKASDSKLEVVLKNVSMSDAGFFQFYVSITQKLIANYGQKLIVVGEPNQPTISMLPSSSLVVGQSLELVCEPNSTTRPADHGLSSKIRWLSEGQDVDGPGGDPRLSKNQAQHLVLRDIERSDENLRFQCRTADSAESIGLTPESIDSEAFTVLPQFGPSRRDLTITPSMDNNAVIQRKNGESVSYQCEAVCRPECDITWLYRSDNGSTGFTPVNGLINKTVLSFLVDRYKHGSYRCRAQNPIGLIRHSFQLDVMYMNSPEIKSKGAIVTEKRVVEGKQIKFECRIDCNPEPKIRWVSPSGALLYSETPRDPNVTTGPAGVLEHWYTSQYTLDAQRCEDSGIYMCTGKNEVQDVEGRFNMVIMCPPSSVDDEELSLKSEYLWQIPYGLMFRFVIRANPSPVVTQVFSRLNGVTRPEPMPTDIQVATIQNYDGKAYLTHFRFQVMRQLDLSDANRVFTMTLESSEFVQEFEFIIKPRGPPHSVTNLTVSGLNHESLTLTWLPGFDGGEVQTFSILHRPKPSDGGGDEDNNSDVEWTLAAENLPNTPDDRGMVSARVTSLGASTTYVVRVIAFNELGNSTSSDITLITTAVPEDSLSAGAIAGIVILVIVILCVLAVLFYWFVYRKRWGAEKEGGIYSRPMLPSALTNLFRRKERPTEENGTVTAEGPLTRIRKLLKSGKSKPQSPHYDSVAMNDRSTSDEDDDDDYGDNAVDGGTYENPPAKPPRENIYANATAMNNNKNEDTRSQGRTVNDEGLTYVSLDFSEDASKNGNNKNNKKKEENIVKPKADEVEYSVIDFSKTAERAAASVADDKSESQKKKRKDKGPAKKDSGPVDGVYGTANLGTAV